MIALTANTKGRKYELEVDEKSPTTGKLNGEAFNLDCIQEKEGSYHLIHNDKSYTVEIFSVSMEKKEVTLTVNNIPFTVALKDHYDLLLEKMGMSDLQSAKVSNLKAPMPGLVLDVVASGGQAVKKGDPLLVLEAMKMENILKSPADGIVKEIVVNQGDAVEKNQLLLNFQ